MRLLLAVLALAVTVSVAATTAFASDNVDNYFTDRLITSDSGPSVSVTAFSVTAGARSAGEIYQELRQDNVGQ